MVKAVAILMYIFAMEISFGLVVAMPSVEESVAQDGQKNKTEFSASPQVIEEFRKLKFGMLMQWDPSVLRGKEISWSRKGAKAELHQGGNLDPEYDAYYKTFNPVNYNALELCKTLKDAGMRYATYCSKHHDGFCMWDTKLSDYKITNPHCPAGRDLQKEWAEACREVGLKFGLYPSQPDWIDPDYLRDAESHEKFIARLHGWVRELCSNYGTVDIIYFDGLGGLASNWGSKELFRMIRELQPNAMVNSRCGAYDVKDWPPHKFMPLSVEHTRQLPFIRGYPGDFDTPESWYGKAEIQRMQTDRPWETCSPLQRGQWQYGAGRPFMTAKEVIQLLIGIVGMDGSLTLSVAILPDGTFDPRHVEVLKEIGQWLKTFGGSIYETRGGPYYPTTHGVATYKDTRIFLHLLHWPSDTLVLPPIQRKLIHAAIITGGKVEASQDSQGVIRVSVPKNDRKEIDTIVELTLDGLASEAKPGRLTQGSLATGKKVRASNVYSNQPWFSPENAIDDDMHTRWATDFATRQAWLEIDLGTEREFNSVMIREDLGFVRKFEVQIQKDGHWLTVLTGGKIGDDFRASFSPVKSSMVRLNILDADCAPQFPARLYGINSHMAAFPGPSIWEFQVIQMAGKMNHLGVKTSGNSTIIPVIIDDIAGKPGTN